MLGPGDAVDRYEIVRLIGSGGMGQVYEARDPRLQRSIALKVMHAGQGDRKKSDVRLLREARLAAALQHPNVVVIHDVGEIREPEALAATTYVAMELIEGSSLRAYVGDAAVPMKERLRILRDVGSALGAAHARGLVHRDVKPENVMIRDDGVVKVLDFGIAKRATQGDEAPPSGLMLSTTGEGMTVGTPLYMAPEQMRGEELDGRADQFAWAVLAYELLAGELPWTITGDSLQLVAQVLSRDPPLLSTKNPDVPTPVEAAVMRALAKSRELRFASMIELLQSIDGDEAAWTPGPARAAMASGSSFARGSARDLQLAATERSETPDRRVEARPRLLESGTMATAAPAAVPSESVHLPVASRRPLAIGVAVVGSVAVIGAAIAFLGSHPSTQPGAASAPIVNSSSSSSSPSATPVQPRSSLTARSPLPPWPAPSPIASVSAVDAAAPAAPSAPHTSHRHAVSQPAPVPPTPAAAPASTDSPYDHM